MGSHLQYVTPSYYSVHFYTMPITNFLLKVSYSAVVCEDVVIFLVWIHQNLGFQVVVVPEVGVA